VSDGTLLIVVPAGMHRRARRAVLACSGPGAARSRDTTSLTSGARSSGIVERQRQCHELGRRHAGLDEREQLTFLEPDVR
jgi:hypothetical protein